MAVDEAILTARIENQAPNTIRFYRWNPSAVSIGKFQDVKNEVQMENCVKLGVDVVRRITGGGTVYHDQENEVTYSVTADKQDLEAKDVTAVYRRVYSGLAEALHILDVDADFNVGNEKNCPNLTVKGKKISGSAQSHKKGVVLQHGTLLADVDLKRMFTLLRVPWAKTCMEVVDVAEGRITSLRKELGRKVSQREVNEALIGGFEKALSVTLEEGDLTSYERTLADRLCKEKYATDEWNLHGKSS